MDSCVVFALVHPRLNVGMWVYCGAVRELQLGTRVVLSLWFQVSGYRIDS